MPYEIQVSEVADDHNAYNRKHRFWKNLEAAFWFYPKGRREETGAKRTVLRASRSAFAIRPSAGQVEAE